MSTKLRSLCLALAMAAGTTTALTAPAAAAETTTCQPTVSIFTMQADGDLWLYEHADPINGSQSWAGARQVGWGWGGKTFAGADGRIYNITDGGELRRLRYHGSGWDTFPNGGQYEAIGWGWQRYLTERTKITTDADGAIYTLEGDQLRWWKFDEQTRQWTHDSGRIVDTGWSRFNSITGSAPGTIQARDANLELHRFRFDRSTERAMVYDRVDTTNGWRPWHQILSAGGDVYYAVDRNTGHLLWNRQTESDLNWHGYQPIGYDWGTDRDVTASTTDCTVSGLRMPNLPHAVGGNHGELASVAQPVTGGLHLLGVKTMGATLFDQYSTESGWTSRQLDGTYVGVSDGVVNDEAETATVASTFAQTGAVLLHTVKNDQWSAPVSIKGGMETKPSIVSRSDGTVAVYAAGDRGTGSTVNKRKLYVREQVAGGFRPWIQFGSPDVDYTGDLSVITDPANRSLIVATRVGGGHEVFRHEQGKRPVGIGSLPPDATGRVVLSGDGGNGVIAFASKGQTLVSVRGGFDGFGSSWTPVADAAAKGITGEVVDAHVVAGMPLSTVVVAKGDGGIFVTRSTEPGVFQPWRTAAPADGTYAGVRLFPTRGGNVGLVTGGVADRRYYTADVPLDPTAPMEFTGGPIG